MKLIFDLGTARYGEPGSQANQFLDRGREWIHKWVDYLCIGNGAGLLACAEAVRDSGLSARSVGLCALPFAVGVCAAALIPALRYQLAGIMWQRETDAEALGAAQYERQLAFWRRVNAGVSVLAAAAFVLGVAWAVTVVLGVGAAHRR